MPSFREELIDILRDPIDFGIFSEPILWDEQTFSASNISDMIKMALGSGKTSIANPLTNATETLQVGKDSAKGYFPANIIVAIIIEKFGRLLEDSLLSPEESREQDKYLSQTLYSWISTTKISRPILFEDNIVVKKIEEACKEELKKQEEFRNQQQQREEFSKKHAAGRKYLEGQEQEFRKQLEDARKDAKEEVVRRQLAREKLLARTKPAWGTSVGARDARKGSFSSSDSSSPGTSMSSQGSQRVGRPLHSFPVPSGTTSRPLTPGIDKRGAPPRLVPIASDSSLLELTPKQKALRANSLQRRAEMKQRWKEDSKKRSSSVGSGVVLPTRPKSAPSATERHQRSKTPNTRRNKL